jgi:glycosyltransferase involved in cell wall biosynthesis
MRIAFVSVEDPHDVGSWSGLNYFISRALERQGLDLSYVGPLHARWETAYKVRQAFYRYGRRRTHIRQFEPGLMRAWGREVTRALRGIWPDAVLAPGAYHVLEARTDVPIVTYGDATFASLLGYYDRFSRLSAATVRNGHRLSRLSVARSAASVYSSAWAARSAVEDYGADPSHVHVVPFGANLEPPPSAEATDATIRARRYDRCRLLFLGVEWARKGGNLALAVAERLHEGGVPVELTVAGCAPVVAGPLPPFVRPLGFISKGTPEGRARLDALLAESHFLVVPSRAEAYGLVYCEASAFGVPSLARRTGGIPVRDGVNGWTFPPDAGPEPYAERIVALMRDPEAHRSVCRTARAEYEARLNWDVAGAALRSILENVVAERG